MRKLTVLNLPLQKEFPGVALGVGFEVAVFWHHNIDSNNICSKDITFKPIS
jgi:hypothetical protein